MSINVADSVIERVPGPAGPMATHTTRVYIVCSPRPRVGKTLLARLLTEFFVMEGLPVAAFDLDREGRMLSDYLPAHATASTIGDTRGQMTLFDRLTGDDAVSKVVDPGHSRFEEFFAVVEKLGFFDEIDRHAIEPVMLFLVDPDPSSAKAYADLRRRFAEITLVPVLNEAVAKGHQYRDLFPFTGASAVPLKIPLLSPALKSIVDEQTFSFGGFRAAPHELSPDEVRDDLQSWLMRVLLELRELELRLLLDKVRSSLQLQL